MEVPPAWEAAAAADQQQLTAAAAVVVIPVAAVSASLSPHAAVAVVCFAPLGY